MLAGNPSTREAKAEEGPRGLHSKFQNSLSYLHGIALSRKSVRENEYILFQNNNNKTRH